MSPRAALAAALVLAGIGLAGSGGTAGTGLVRLVIADLPYGRVWAASLRALEGFPVARAEQGVIVTERVERAPRPEELAEVSGAERVAERVTVRVDAFGTLSTRVTIAVEAWALRDGAWTPLADTGTTARGIADRLRAAPG